MIHHKTTTLENGIKIITHHKKQSNIAIVSITYKVGSKHETPNKTGTAHLLEHIMFGGSKNIPSYDHTIQQSGGINNAYTTPDTTTYYSIIPKNNIETALWAEADRMLHPNLDKKTIEIQKKVVIEELKETQNKPYANTWPTLYNLAYTQHHYKWPTIGKNTTHIQQTTQQDITQFFKKFYNPQNTIITITGNITHKTATQLTAKYFQTIPNKNTHNTHTTTPQEPPQHQERTTTLNNKVPLKAIYKAYHIPPITQTQQHYTAQLTSNIIAQNTSSTLHKKLIINKQYMTNIQSYTTETHDHSLLIIQGKINNKYQTQEINKQITQTIQTTPITQQQLQKAKNQLLTHIAIQNTNPENITHTLTNAHITNTLHQLHNTTQIIQNITTTQINNFIKQHLNNTNCTTILHNNTPQQSKIN